MGLSKLSVRHERLTIWWGLVETSMASALLIHVVLVWSIFKSYSSDKRFGTRLRLMRMQIASRILDFQVCQLTRVEVLEPSLVWAWCLLNWTELELLEPFCSLDLLLVEWSLNRIARSKSNVFQENLLLEACGLVLVVKVHFLER